MSPIADGVKPIVKVALCPTIKVNGSDGVLILKLESETAAWAIVKASLLEFVIVKFWLLVVPICTFPKLRFEGLTERFPGATHPDWQRAAHNTAARIEDL